MSHTCSLDGDRRNHGTSSRWYSGLRKKSSRLFFASLSLSSSSSLHFNCLNKAFESSLQMYVACVHGIQGYKRPLVLFFFLWTLGYRFDVQVCRKSCCSSSSSHWILIFRVWSSLPVAYLFTKILHLPIEFRFLGFGAHCLLHLFTKILGGRIFINWYFWFNE
jgi:hypothetical protein